MTTPKIPRALERYPLGEKLEGERWSATDRDRGRDVTVTRVAFGPDRVGERDAFVERSRSLYTVNAPSLVAVYDAGAWDDDAFVVEERIVEPQPLDAMDLDAREKALAARAIADAVDALNRAGFSLASLEVVLDAYRQPKISVAREAEPATVETRARDLDQVAAVVESLVPGTPPATSLAALGKAIDTPAATTQPLIHASAPKRSPWIWAVVVLGALAAAVLLYTRL